MHIAMTPNKDEITRELKELGLRDLASYSKGTGFQVPEGYFASFSSRLSEKIEREEKVRLPRNFREISLRAAFSMAASFLLLIALGISIIMLRKGNNEEFLVHSEEFIYDEYFARVSEMDRALMYDLILTPEDTQPGEFFQTSFHEEDYLLDYLLDAAPYNGIEPMELIIQQDINNQP